MGLFGRACNEYLTPRLPSPRPEPDSSRARPPGMRGTNILRSRIGATVRALRSTSAVREEIGIYVFAAHLSQAGLTEEMLHGFADSCAALGLPIRVDIHDPSDVAMSVELPAWTVSRCGPDAIPSSQQVTPQKSPTGAERGNWHLIGANGQLISAYGVRPMKDVLWSISVQPNPYRDHNKPIVGRLNIEHDLIVATLSTGPVGIGDSVGHSNRNFLLPAMRADGVILTTMRTDQCQGPCYRLSKAKDFSSGQRT